MLEWLPAHHLLEHTGEVVLRIRARDWGDFLAEAGRALGKLELGSADGRPTGSWKRLEVTAPDREALLVEWLNELLFHAESERWIPTEFEVVTASPTQAVFRARGVEVEETPGFVKAATYHGLAVREIDGILEGDVLLDV